MVNWIDLQAAGNDSGSLWQDPLFVDPATHNYALTEGSPAFDLGIEEIEVDNIGVQSIGKYYKKWLCVKLNDQWRIKTNASHRLYPAWLYHLVNEN